MPKQFEISLAFTADTKQAQQQMQNLQKTLNDLAQPKSGTGSELKITKEIQQAQMAASQLAISLQNATNADTGRLNLTKFSSELKSSGKTLEDYRKSLSLLGKDGEQAFVNLAEKVVTADSSIKNSNKILNDLYITLKNTAKWELSSSLIKGFTGAISEAFGYAQNLNESLTQIQIVTGNSSEQMAQFAKQANIAAKQLSTTTVEYADAALIYYQQGLGETETKARTDITVAAANAAGISAEEMSDYLTAVWNSYKVGTDELEHYADVMAAVGAGTATSLEEISSAMEKVASVGESTGVNFEQLSAIIATVSSVTRQSAESIGTGYKTILARMADLELEGSVEEDGITTTLGSVSSQLKAVGVDILDTNGDLRDMGVVLEELMGKWNGMDRATQQAIAIAIAGKRQYTQLLALMNNQDMYWDAVQMGVESDGETQRQAEVYAESWEAAQKRVKAAAEGIYDSLINDDFFISLNNGFADILGLIEKLIDSIGGFGGVLGGLGLIATRVFNQQITNSLNNMLESMYSNSYINKFKTDELRKEAVKQQALLYGDDAVGIINKQRLELQQKLESSYKNMTAEEIKLAQAALDTNKAYANRAIELNQIALDQKAETDLITEDAFSDIYDSSLQLEANGQYVNLDQQNNRLKELIQNFKEGKDIIPQASQDIKNGIEGLNSRLQSAFNVSFANSSATELYSALSTIPNLSNEAADEIGKFMNKLDALDKAYRSNSITSEEYNAELQKIKRQLQDLTKISGPMERGFVEQAQALGISEEVATKLWFSLQKLQEAENNAKNATDNFKNSCENLILTGQRTESVIKIFAQGLTSGLQSISGFAMGISSLKQAWDTFKDPNIGGLDKFLQIMTSISFGLPALTSGISNFGQAISGIRTEISSVVIDTSEMIAAQTAQNTIQQAVNASLNEEQKKEILSTALKREKAAVEGLSAKQKLTYLSAAKLGIPITAKEIAQDGKAAAAKVTNSIATGTLTKSETALAAATGLVNVQFRALFTALAPILAPFLGIAAAVGALVVAFELVEKTSPEAKLEKAKEQAKEASDAFKSASNEVTELSNAWSEFQNSRDTFDGLTKGTQEWTSALIEANQKTLELLDSYSALKQYSYVDENGLIQISEEGYNQVLRAQQIAALAAYNSSLDAEANIAELENYVDENEFAKQLEDKYNIYMSGSARNNEGYLVSESPQDVLNSMIEGYEEQGEAFFEDMRWQYERMQEDIVRGYAEDAEYRRIQAIATNTELQNEIRNYWNERSKIDAQRDENNTLLATQAAAIYGVTNEDIIEKYIKPQIAQKDTKVNEQFSGWWKDFSEDDSQLRAIMRMIGAEDFVDKSGDKITFVIDGEEKEYSQDQIKQFYGANLGANLAEEGIRQSVETALKDITPEDVTLPIKEWVQGLTEEQVSTLAQNNDIFNTLERYGADARNLSGENLGNLADALANGGTAQEFANLGKQLSISQEKLDAFVASVKNLNEAANLTNFSGAISALQQGEELTDEQRQALDAMKNSYLELGQIGDETSREFIETAQKIRQSVAATEQDQLFAGYDEAYNHLISLYEEDGITPKANMDEIESALDELMKKDYEIEVAIRSDIDATVEEFQNDANQLQEAANLIQEGFKVSANDIQAVAAAFPGILEGYTVTADGMIQLNSDIAQSSIEAATTEAQANKESALIKLDAEIAYWQAKQQIYANLAQGFAELAQSDLTAEEAKQKALALIDQAGTDIAELQEQRKAEFSRANALLDEKYAKQTTDAEGAQLETSVENVDKAYQAHSEASKMSAEAQIANAIAVAKANKAAAEGKPEEANTADQLRNSNYTSNFSAQSNDENKVDQESTSIGDKVNSTTGESIEELINNIGANTAIEDVKATLELAAETAQANADNAAANVNTLQAQKATIEALGIAVPNLVNTAGRDSSSSGDKGSGSDSSEEPKTRTPQHTEKQDTASDLELPEEVVERYENTDNLLASIERRLTKIGNEREGLWGDGFIAKLDEENEALQDQIDLLGWQMDEAKKYAEEDLGTLRGAGIDVQLDENGIITNAEQIRAAIQQMRIDEAKAYDAQVNAANANYDAQVNALAADDSEGENALKTQNEVTLQGFEDAHNAKTKYFDSLEEALDNYDEDWNKYWDNAEEREEILQQIRENNLEKITHKLEIQMEMTEFERNNMEFLRSTFREGLFGIQDNINFDNAEISNYSLDLQNINSAIDELNTQFANGEISEEQYATTLKDLTDQARDASQSIVDLSKQIGEYWVEALEDSNSILEENLDNFEHLLSLMDSFESLTKLITSEDNYSGLSDIYDDIVEISRDALTASQANYEFLAEQEAVAERMYQDGIAKGLDQTTLDQLKENWETARQLAQEGQEQMLSDAQAFGEAAQQQYENTVNQIMEEYEDAVTSGKGFDWMNAQMEHLQLKDTEYLTETNKLYQTQKLIRQANLDLENTENKAAQNRLQSFIKETEELENQTNVSAYALGIQERKYQVLLAEIALQEAQNAKDQVRLQRDTEGNFNYVYTADEDSIAEAEQELADAQNDLYNYVREKENEIRQAELEAQQEHAQNIADIWITYANDKAARDTALLEENKRFQDEMAMYKELSNLSMEASDQAYSDSYAANLNDRYLATEESAAYQIDANAQLEDANTSLQENNEVVSDVINENYGDMQSKSNEFATEASDDLREVESVMKTVTANTQQWVDTMGSLIGSVTNHFQELAASCRTAMEVISGFQSTVDYSLLGYNAGSYAEALQHWTTRDTAIEYNIDNKGQFTENDLGGLDLVQGVGTDLAALILSSASWQEAAHWAQLREAKKSDQVSGDYYDSTQSTKAFLAQRFGENSSEYQWIIDKLREKKVPGFDTGGYTGEFDGGKLALLHEKELVLNKQDTQNLLDTIDIVDKLLSTLNYQNLLAGFGVNGLENNIRQDSDKLEQEVTIHAEFPNVQTHDEIEQAIYNLTNTAAQYANRKRL